MEEIYMRHLAMENNAQAEELGPMPDILHDV